jgi:hypothetical protein
MTNYAEILGEMGYPVQDCGEYIKTQAIYRDGQTIGSVAVYKNKNLVIDFVTGQKYSWEEFIKLCTGDEAKSGELIGKTIKAINSVPKLIIPQTFDVNILSQLVPDHSYWLNRGISLNTIQKFKGGVMMEGKLKNRYTFPVFNQKMEVCGLFGRDLTNKSFNKYKIFGAKSKDFVYPAFLNSKVIQEKKEVILVEGVGCCLSLYECGIENSLVLFGTHLGVGIINYLLKVNPTRIIIATNNDSHNVGQEAAVTINRVLCRYFDRKSIVIDFPPRKDFNDTLVAENGKEMIYKWYENHKH